MWFKGAHINAGDVESYAHYRYVKVPAQTSSITPIQVCVDEQPDLINLTRSFVKLNVAFKTTGNANLTSHAYTVAAMLIPANDIAHTLFKHINCRPKGTLLKELPQWRYIYLVIKFLWPTTNQLNALMDSDSEFCKYFVSTLACDELPETPEHVRPRAYIVNTHLADKLREYWIPVWTKNDTCELLDSYVLPLTTSEIVMSPRWLFRIYMLAVASVRQAYMWTCACLYIRFLRTS